MRKVERDILQGHCRDRVRGNAFKLQESRFRLYIRKKFFTVKVMRYWRRLCLFPLCAQRDCGYSLPRSVQGQVRWSSEPPGLVECVHGRGVGTTWSQTILSFYESIFCMQNFVRKTKEHTQEGYNNFNVHFCHIGKFSDSSKVSKKVWSATQH